MSGADDDGTGNATEPQTVESAVDDPYRHELQAGFPKSMLAPTPASGKLISMLRSRGLTTSVIKEVLGRPWARQLLGKVNGRREDAIVRLLSSPYLRANHFVWTAERRAVAPYYYFLSPENAIL